MGGVDGKGIPVDTFVEWAEKIPAKELEAMFAFDIVDPGSVDFDHPNMLADPATNTIAKASSVYIGGVMPLKKGSNRATMSALDTPTAPSPGFMGAASPISETSLDEDDAANRLGLLDLGGTGSVSRSLALTLPLFNCTILCDGVSQGKKRSITQRCGLE